jgi:hypothetical protein
MTGGGGAGFTFCQFFFQLFCPSTTCTWPPLSFRPDVQSLAGHSLTLHGPTLDQNLTLFFSFTTNYSFTWGKTFFFKCPWRATFGPRFRGLAGHFPRRRGPFLARGPGVKNHCITAFKLYTLPQRLLKSSTFRQYHALRSSRCIIV